MNPDPLDADPELAGFVDDVLGDPRTGRGDQTLRHCLEHLVVTLEGSGLAVALPVGFEDHLGDPTGICPSGRDHLSAFGRAPVQEHHVGVFGKGGIEDGPDQIVSLIVPARESNPRAFGAVHLGLLAPLGREIGTAVHHGGSQAAMRDLGSGAG